jgi:hypothetical protein
MVRIGFKDISAYSQDDLPNSIRDHVIEQLEKQGLGLAETKEKIREQVRSSLISEGAYGDETEVNKLMQQDAGLIKFVDDKAAESFFATVDQWTKIGLANVGMFDSMRSKSDEISSHLAEIAKPILDRHNQIESDPMTFSEKSALFNIANLIEYGAYRILVTDEVTRPKDFAAKDDLHASLDSITGGDGELPEAQRPNRYTSIDEAIKMLKYSAATKDIVKSRIESQSGKLSQESYDIVRPILEKLFDLSDIDFKPKENLD